MKTTCLNHPVQEKLIIIREWQLNFCGGDACEAALISFFEYWHNIKLEQRQKNKKANDIAELHGDSRSQDESLLQFHTEEDLEKGILIFKKDKIRTGIKNLQNKGVITVTKNPNPKYTFDRTKFFLFNPRVCNEWLKKYYLESNEGRKKACQNTMPDQRKIVDASPKNPSPSPKNRGSIITEITTEITNNNNTHIDNNINTPEAQNGNSPHVCVSSSASPSSEYVVNSLKAWFNQEVIDQFISKYPINYLNEKIDLTLAANPKNPAGFFSKALQEDWKHAPGQMPTLPAEPVPEWVKEEIREYVELVKQEYLDNPDIADWEKKWGLDWEEKRGYFPHPEIVRILKEFKDPRV